ncbi:MAG: AMP-binding protein [Actinobacteria bacterium]|nr:AMP-binding protein [Actinomycetota bacterium]
MNTGMLLEMAADGMGDRIAVGSRKDGLTYAALADQARRVASVVAESGAERVVFVAQNSALLPALLFGSGFAGVPFVPVNYRLADEQLCAILARTAPAIAVVDDDAVGRVSGVDGLTVLSLAALQARIDATSPAEAGFVDPDDIAVLLYTSGTTGEPKAAVLRHKHLASYVISTVEFMGAGDDHAALVSVPPYHVAGMATILTSVYGGRRIVYLPQFDPARWVSVARGEVISHAMVVPTMLGRILDVIEAGGEGLPGLLHLAYGGGRMPVPVLERALQLLPAVGFVNAYGLTETASTIATLSPEDHRAAFESDDPAVRARLGSVGRPLPMLELEIRDSDGKPLPPGARGEIYVRGEQVAGEYIGRSALTADGWFPTNDGGWLDDGGFLFVEGRLDDVIVRGAENLSPGEIEDTLVTHPAVAEAGVVGIPDDEWGETVAAAVVLKPGAGTTVEELQAWIRDRLRSSRTPTVIQFRTELPYNETGKLLRRVLRTELTRPATAG